MVFGHKKRTLKEALAAAGTLRQESYRTAAYQKAKSYTYLDMSNSFAQLLRRRASGL